MVRCYKHRDYPKDCWVVSCFDISVDSKLLNHKRLDKAKLEALELINEKLKRYSDARELVEKEITKLNDVNVSGDEQ